MCLNHNSLDVEGLFLCEEFREHRDNKSNKMDFLQIRHVCFLVAFLITALQALSEYSTVSDEVFARAVIEKAIIFIVIKMHYRFPLSLKLTVILVVAFLIVGMAYGC